jgi:hypothetical protein
MTTTETNSKAALAAEPSDPSTETSEDDHTRPDTSIDGKPANSPTGVRWLRWTLFERNRDYFRADSFKLARHELQLWKRNSQFLHELLDRSDGHTFPDIEIWIRRFRQAAISSMYYLSYAQLKAVASATAVFFLIMVLLPVASLDIETYTAVFFCFALTTFGVYRLVDWRVEQENDRIKWFLITWAALFASIGFVTARSAGASPGSIVMNANKLSFAQLLSLLPLVSAAWVLVSLILGIIVVRTFNSARRRHLATSPGVAAISFLLEVVDKMSRPDSFIFFEDRSSVVRDLEMSAWLIESALPAYLPVADPAQRMVVKDRLRACAFKLRSMTLWVALPGPTTHIDLVSVCGDIIRPLVTGHYDELPNPAMPLRSKRQVLRSCLGLARLLLAGALPAVVLIGVRRLGVVVSGSLGAAATIFCIAWAVVTYLQLIDPLLTQRLSTIRELLGLVRGGFGGSDNK